MKTFVAQSVVRRAGTPAGRRHGGHLLLLGLLQILLAGCSSLSRPLPPVDLSQPGWSVHQGQAVWTLPHHEREIAGEVLVATGPQGGSFVQFSKSPFTLVTGQTTRRHWQVEFPPQNKHYAGPGTPPKRLMWLYLGRVLAGQPPPDHWTWTNKTGNWDLENPGTGEKIEGFFNQ